MAVFSLLFLLFATIKNSRSNADNSEYTFIHSSCADINIDGLYYIKPLRDLPALPVICSNGYSMLDVSLDANLKSYPSHLTSWDYGRTNTEYILSRLDDLSSFREWFLPSAADTNSKFKIAPNCNECIDGDYGDQTVYYIDSHTFCFSAAVINGCIEDKESVNYHIESCNQCDVGLFEENDKESNKWIKCEAVHMSADQMIDHNHMQCVAHGLSFHPVLSLTGNSCTCWQPQSQLLNNQTHKVLLSELPLVTSSKDAIQSNGFYVADNIQFAADKQQKNEKIDVREKNIVYLYNSDFVNGTFRIKESGTYIIMEDIVFNFNAPTNEQMADDNFSPNDIYGDELHWFPTHKQAENEYPGLYTYVGAYSLGFFAGITIETNHVTIDLNGFTLKQHFSFYFQQRFFSLIELASQPFIPGQGKFFSQHIMSHIFFYKLRSCKLGRWK